MNAAEIREATAKDAPDVLSLWDFFETFVYQNRVSLTLHDEHREICDVYERAICGEFAGVYEYIIVDLCRRIGKTKLLEALGCWTLGEFDDAQIIEACYSSPLVRRSLAYIGRTLRMPWYLDLYGDRLHTIGLELVTTLAGGSLYGAGTGATITGFGAGLKEPGGGYIALDDPAKPDEALSKVESANVIQNFETTFKGCRNSDRFCPIIINAQRLGPDDLPGYVLKTYPNRTLVIKFPCFVAPASRRPSTAPDCVSRFPETWSASTSQDLQKTRVGRFVLASQFQQDPIALGGNLIQIESFKRYDVREAPAMKWETIILTVDTALKAKELNDYSCAQAWGRLSRRAYLFDQVWGKWEAPELLARITVFVAKIRRDFPQIIVRVVIEEKAAGSGLLQQLRANGIPAEGIERDVDKVRRVQAILPYQETGLVYIPQAGSTEWVDGFVAECAEFKPDMTHAHDDRVDCFADGVNLLLCAGPSILDALGAKPLRR